MLALASTLSLAAVSSASELSLNEIARQVNAAKTTWTAHADGRYANKTHADIAALCGTRLPGHPDYVEMNITEPSHAELGLDPSLTVADLPTDFDWRTQGKGCDDIIGLVRCPCFLAALNHTVQRHRLTARRPS